MEEIAQSPYRIYRKAVGPFAMNQYMLVHGRRALIIDPGGEPEPFLRELRRLDASVEAILLTHAHVDHVLGLPETAAATGAPIYMHPLDAPLLEAAPMQGAMFGVSASPMPAPDHELQDGQKLALAGLTLSVLHTPGHAPGHCVFHDVSGRILLGGDLLFAGSIGRIDLPGADVEAMKRSLRRILELDDTTRVLPGHMGETTIGRERDVNPFLKAGALP